MELRTCFRYTAVQPILSSSLTVRKKKKEGCSHTARLRLAFCLLRVRPSESLRRQAFINCAALRVCTRLFAGNAAELCRMFDGLRRISLWTRLLALMVAASQCAFVVVAGGYIGPMVSCQRFSAYAKVPWPHRNSSVVLLIMLVVLTGAGVSSIVVCVTSSSFGTAKCHALMANPGVKTSRTGQNLHIYPSQEERSLVRTGLEPWVQRLLSSLRLGVQLANIDWPCRERSVAPTQNGLSFWLASA